MLELILITMAFLYSTFFSVNWLWLFPIALVIFFVKEHLREKEKKNKNNKKRG